MRVYLEQGQTAVGKKGAKTRYRGKAFYNVPAKLGKKWCDEKAAKLANDKNEVVDEKAASAAKPLKTKTPKK